eukprot:g86.t1
MSVSWNKGKHKTTPSTSNSLLFQIAIDGNKPRTNGASPMDFAGQNVLLLNTGKTSEGELSKKGRFCQCPSTYPRVSFDSMDSSTTSALSNGSFRIGANRESPTSVHSDLQECIEKKLLATGLLENCTRIMQSLTTSPQTASSVPVPTHAALGQALSSEDATSVMKVVVATVSLGLDLKSSRTLHQFVQQRVKTVERRERQLEDLKERRMRESRNPEALYLEKQNQEMEKTIEVFSAHNFQLKCSIREVAIEVGHLREAEKDATVTVRKLYDCRDKYNKVCDENRDLNKTVQQLQGSVRVLCQLSQPPRHKIGYLTSSNRGEVTLQLKQKVKTFTFDAVATGPPSTSSFKDDVLPILTSVLDGFDATIVSMGSCSCDLANARDEGSFVGTLSCMISTLLNTANGRFYHESYMFDFEILLITPEESILFAEKRNLITAMALDDDDNGFMTVDSKGKNYDNKIRKLLTDIFSRRELLDAQQNAHVVLRLNVQRRHKPTNAKSTSEITFIHVNASSNGRWVQDNEVNGVVSALIKISSGNLRKDEDLEDNLIQELYRPSSNPRLYLLYVQLQNEPVHEKTNLAALTMCNDIIHARTVKDSSTEWTGPGRKKIAQLEKAISEKDKLINGMEKQKEKVEEQKGQLDSDIERLKAQISALKELRSKPKKTPEFAASTKERPVKNSSPLDQSKSPSRGIEFRERVSSKNTVTRRIITQESRIPLPKASSVPPRSSGVSGIDRVLSSTIKTHARPEELRMHSEIHRPLTSRLSRLPRDSNK